uniref:K Homology domain-containing protein n=1 Tax=Globodera rostochiensis TaxID=31243 RepID=A0A914HXM4_GLORO
MFLGMGEIGGTVEPQEKSVFSKYGTWHPSIERKCNHQSFLLYVLNRLSESFSNARVGQWYSVDDGGQFWPIEPPLKTMTVSGDDTICCKIAMPVTFSSDDLVFGGVNTFHSPFCEQIGGSVLFSLEEAKLDRGICYKAFVSLTSFNAPPPILPKTVLRGNSCWSLVRKEDICGLWNGVDIASALATLKMQSNSVAVGSRLLLSTPSVPLPQALLSDSELVSSSGRRTSLSKSVPPPPLSQSNDGGGKSGEGSPSAQSSKSVPDLAMSNGIGTAKDKSLKGEIGSKRHSALVLCWKKTAEDSFLVICSDEQPRLRERIQCRNSSLSSNHKISVGKFYTVEYSRYSAKSSPHVRIFVLNETSSPMETRLVNGELQLRIFMWRTKELYWSEYCEVSQLPKASPDVCLAWCKLSDKLTNGFNILVFVELIDDLLKSNAMPPTANSAGSHRQLDAIELDELFGPDQIFDTDPLNRSVSPDSITAEIESSKALKPTRINSEKTSSSSSTVTDTQTEKKKLAIVYMQIKRTFHPWIRGPFNKALKAMDRTGVNIEFKLNSNDIVLSGIDRSRVEEYAAKLRTLRDGPIRKARERKCPVATKLLKSIADVTDDLLAESGAIVVLPEVSCTDDKMTVISLLGSAEQIEHAWNCFRDFYGSSDVEELIAESSEKKIEDDKLLRCIAAAQQKSLPSGACGGRTTKAPEAKKSDGKIDNGKGEEFSENPHRQPTPFASSHCPQRSNSPLPMPNKVLNNKMSLKLGATIRKTSTSTLSLAQIRRKQIEYPDWQWRYLETGDRQQPTLNCDFKEFGRLYFSGPSDAVEELYKKMYTKISQLTKNSTIVKDSVVVERQFHCQVIGKGGEFLRRLKRRHGVKEIFVPSEFSRSEQIRIEGPSLVSIRSCKDDLMQLVDNWRNDVYEEVRVQRRFVPMIRGKNSSKIIGLLDGLPKVEVDLPPHVNDDAAEDNVIKIRGHRSEVVEFVGRLNVFIDNLAKNHHEDLIQLPFNDPNHSSLEFANWTSKAQTNPSKMAIEQLRKIVVCHVDTSSSSVHLACDQRHHAEFLRNKAQLLREIKEEHGRCIINLNKPQQRFEISSTAKYNKAAVESAKAHIEKIIDTLESKTRHRVDIPIRFHLRVQMPSKDDDDENAIVVIGPDKAAVEGAEKALRALCPVTEHVVVSADHRLSLMGHDGTNLEELGKKHSIQIIVPRCDANASCEVSVSGDPGDVRACLKEIRECILPSTRTISVSDKVRGSLIGHGGNKLKQLCDKYSQSYRDRNIGKCRRMRAIHPLGNCAIREKDWQQTL